MNTEVSSDPYELKLYQMFQSCNESKQHCGLLDEEALRRLCALLELRDKGTALISSLATNGSLKLGVSFEQFKEALLNFLGTEFDSQTASVKSFTSANNEAICFKERSLVLTDNVTVDSAYVESPPELSDREVSPKLVVGSKKYGRRSRPHLHNSNNNSNNAAIDDFSVSDSDNTDDENVQLQERQRITLNCNSIEQNNAHVQRSASQNDLPGRRRLRPNNLTGNNKLKRCSSLPGRKNLQQLNKFNASTHPSNKINAQFLQQQQQLNSSVESLDMISTPTQLETLSAQYIVDIWSQANIINGRNMLIALGFDEDNINVIQLIKVLEDELRPLDDDPQSNMLRALVALQNGELSNLRQAYGQLHEENVKLRADNKEANRRVAILAVEVDERHASLEDNSKRQIQMLEQRHASVVRELTLRLANDRDNWTNLTTRLESNIKSLEQEEIKLKTELELIRNENIELETEHQRAQKQINELLEENIKLHREQLMHSNAEESISKNVDSTAAKQRELMTDDKSCADDDEIFELMQKVNTLQIENSRLRDKNDELMIEVENLSHELARTKLKSKKTNTTASPPTNVCDDAHENELEQSTNAGAMATKRRGDSPSKTRSNDEIPRLGKLRKCGDESTAGSEISDTSGEWMALNNELKHRTNAEEDINNLKDKIVKLEEQLQTAKLAPQTNEERCKELENSLEQMQRAYEDCEDYWQAKLNEERQLFEKERQIYEDEQHESDRKFTELMEKVREYEEQFSKDGRLSPIEERDYLEQQYADLEAETVEIRKNSLNMLEEKSKEIAALQNEIEDLRQRLGESVEILTGACELNSETVAQLQADSVLSPASSPISYLWHQSTIQEPAKNVISSQINNNENDLNEKTTITTTTTTNAAANNNSPTSSNNKLALAVNRNLSTSETTIFSTTTIDGGSIASTVAPIQKPNRAKSPQHNSEGEIADCETSSTASNKSFDTHSLTSQKCNTPSSLKEELKRLKFFELSLKEQIKDLSLQRDGLVMELQQLQEARPVLEKAYARTSHPSLIQRVNQLELKNRHLQNVIKQQQQYTESLMQQTWRQHQVELNELHTRIEAQTVMLTEQTQRLQSADVLVKDLYVENSHLTATVQRLEQQRARVNLIHQQQQQQQTAARAMGVALGGPSTGLP